MRPTRILPRILAVWLTLALALPNSALALRQAGLEENRAKGEVLKALRHPAPTTGLEERSMADLMAQNAKEQFPAEPWLFEYDLGTMEEHLVRGAAGSRWVHFHSGNKGFRMGFLAELDLRDGKIVGLKEGSEILVEPDELLDSLASKRAFVPFSKVISGRDQDFRRPVWAFLQRSKGEFEKAISDGARTASWMALSITPGEPLIDIFSEDDFDRDGRVQVDKVSAMHPSGDDVDYYDGLLSYAQVIGIPKAMVIQTHGCKTTGAAGICAAVGPRAGGVV